MELPMLKQDDQPYVPLDGKCPMCLGEFAGQGFVYLAGGALAEDDVSMEGFLGLGIHGTDPEMHDSAHVDVVKQLAGGQYDIQFCSTDCLKRWFEQLVQVLEDQRSK